MHVLGLFNVYVEHATRRKRFLRFSLYVGRVLGALLWVVAETDALRLVCPGAATSVAWRRGMCVGPGLGSWSEWLQGVLYVCFTLQEKLCSIYKSLDGVVDRRPLCVNRGPGGCTGSTTAAPSLLSTLCISATRCCSSGCSALITTSFEALAY